MILSPAKLPLVAALVAVELLRSSTADAQELLRPPRDDVRSLGFEAASLAGVPYYYQDPPLAIPRSEEYLRLQQAELQQQQQRLAWAQGRSSPTALGSQVLLAGSVSRPARWQERSMVADEISSLSLARQRQAVEASNRLLHEEHMDHMAAAKNALQRSARGIPPPRTLQELQEPTAVTVRRPKIDASTDLPKAQLLEQEVATLQLTGVARWNRLGWWQALVYSLVFAWALGKSVQRQSTDDAAASEEPEQRTAAPFWQSFLAGPLRSVGWKNATASQPGSAHREYYGAVPTAADAIKLKHLLPRTSPKFIDEDDEEAACCA